MPYMACYEYEVEVRLEVVVRPEVAVNVELTVYAEVVVYAIDELYRHVGPYRIVSVSLFPIGVGLTHSSAVGWNPYAESCDYKKNK